MCLLSNFLNKLLQATKILFLAISQGLPETERALGAVTRGEFDWSPVITPQQKR